MSLKSTNEQLAEITGGTGTLSDTLTKLASDISNTYDVVEEKGGTVPANKNTDSLAAAVNSIRSGGGGDDPDPDPSQYGVARFYNYAIEIGKLSNMGGMSNEPDPLVGVDQTKMNAFCQEHNITLSFDRSNSQPIFIGGSDGNYNLTWDDWQQGVSVQEQYSSLADLETATGIRIVEPSSGQSINVEIGKVVTVNKTKPTTDVVLSSASQLANLKGESSWMGGEELFYTINGTEYPAAALKAFYFGSEVCTLPSNYFMNGAKNLVTISQFPTWMTSIPVGSFNNCYSLKKIMLPDTGNVSISQNGQTLYNLVSLEELYVGASTPFSSEPGGYPACGYYLYEMSYTGYYDDLDVMKPIKITGANRAAWVTAWGSVYSQNGYYRYIEAGTN